MTQGLERSLAKCAGTQDPPPLIGVLAEDGGKTVFRIQDTTKFFEDAAGKHLMCVFYFGTFISWPYSHGLKPYAVATCGLAWRGKLSTDDPEEIKRLIELADREGTAALPEREEVAMIQVTTATEAFIYQAVVTRLEGCQPSLGDWEEIAGTSRLQIDRFGNAIRPALYDEPGESGECPPRTASLVIDPYGEQRRTEPVNGTDFKLSEIRRALGNKDMTVQVLRLPGDWVLAMDEDGKAHGLPLNMIATLIGFAAGMSPQDSVVGPVMLIPPGYFR